jgi:aspartate/methionine/tyrosine aminotransferase
MFSSRLPSDLTPNAAARALDSRRARGARVIDLTESNPTRVGLDYPPDLLAPLASARGLQYEPQPLGLIAAREAVSNDFRRRGLTVGADRIALTSSTSEAYSLLFKVLCDPGDTVLVPRPSYPLFEHLTRLDAVHAVPYDLEHHGAWRIDTENVKARLGQARAVLVVSPNNPTGSFLHRADLEALVELLSERATALIGDEVFADYPLDAAPHAASVLAQERVLTFALGGLSKSVGLPQVKLGWVAAGGPAPLVDAFLRRYEVAADAYLSVSTPVQLAVATLLERGAVIRRLIQERIRRNLHALRVAAARVPATRVFDVEGGWSAVVEVPALRPEESIVLDLVVEDGVVVHPGFFYDFPREAFLVLSLLVDPETFDDGVSRLFDRAAQGVQA